MLADLHADQRVLEARDHPARADLDGVVDAFAALEGLAIDVAEEVDDDHVALLGIGAIGDLLDDGGLLAELRELLVDLGVIDLADLAHDGQPFVVVGHDLGLHFDLGGEAKRLILGELEARVDDRRVDREEVLLLDGLPEAVIDEALNDLAFDGALVELLEDLARHVAGAKAFHFGPLLQAFVGEVELVADRVPRDLDRYALLDRGKGLDVNLHNDAL